MAVAADPHEAWTSLVVGMDRDHELVGQLLAILTSLGIPAQAVRYEAAAVVCCVPASRVAEAILALEIHGFADVRAYGDGPAIR